MKSKRIFLSGIADTRNNGQQSMIIALVKELRKRSANLTFIASSISPETDKARLKEFEIDVISLPWMQKDYMSPGQARINFFSQAFLYTMFALLYKFFRINLFGRKVLLNYINSDIIVDLSGDSFSDDNGGLCVLQQLFTLWIGKLLDKPVLILAQSIGPINKQWLRNITKKVFKNLDHITLREEISLKYFRDNNFSLDNVSLTSDLAFLLDKCSDIEIKSILDQENIIFQPEKIILGISPSSILDKFIDYPGNIADFYVSIIKKLFELNSNINIVLIPHVFVKNFDDRELCSQIIHKMPKNKHSISMLTGEYNCEQSKGIISKCDIFAGFRMHPAIAAISLGIPTLTLVPGFKTSGIIGQNFDKKFVLDIRNQDIKKLEDSIIARLSELMQNKEIYSSLIKEKLSEIKPLSQKNIDIVWNFLNDEYKSSR